MIYEHVRAHVPPQGPGLLPEGYELPDELAAPGAIRWAAGARDGVLTHHWGGGPEAAEVDALAEAVRRATSRFSPGAYGRLQERLRELDSGFISLVDPLIERLRTAKLRHDRLYALGHRLATESPYRNGVKLGIVLLGLFNVEPHRDVLLTLGRHDEFTLYALVALGNGQDDPIDDLWTLARLAEGWGRVHAVERLAETDRTDIQDWILRTGFRNSVMDEYLALIAATTGRLEARLAEPDPDDDLLYAAGDVLSALFTGGPAGDIGDYPAGARTTELFVDHLTVRAADLRHLLALLDVHAFLTGEREQWPDGWDAGTVSRLVEKVTEIRDRPMWPDLARAGLAASERLEFYRADRACRALGFSTVDTHVARLRESPLDEQGWFAVMDQAGEATVEGIVAAAEELLPLADIASGPADEVGLGPQWTAHRCLDSVLQGLEGWPGRGGRLVHAGLASPTVRNRNIALRVLNSWPRAVWPPTAAEVLAAAADREPTETLRERMGLVLAGKPLED